MRVTINLDEKLLEEAREITGLTERTTLIHRGLRALIHRDASRRLALLEGSQPDLEKISRRSSDPE